jgi:hypothetical protein
MGGEVVFYNFGRLIYILLSCEYWLLEVGVDDAEKSDEGDQ